MRALLCRDRRSLVSEIGVALLGDAFTGRQRGHDEARPEATPERGEETRAAAGGDVVLGSAERLQALGADRGVAFLGLRETRIQSALRRVGERSIDVCAVDLVLQAGLPERDLLLSGHAATIGGVTRAECARADTWDGRVNGAC